MSKHSKRTGTEKEIANKLFLFIKQWIRSIEGFREGSYTMHIIKLYQLGTGGPPLTQKSLTRFPLPWFLTYVRVSGGNLH